MSTIEANFLCGLRGNAVNIGPLPPPSGPGSAVSKGYVDNAIAAIPNLTANDPIEIVNEVITIAAADGATHRAGCVTGGPQSIGGDKTFVDKVYIGGPASHETEVATKGYVDSSALTASDPLSISNGTISMTPAGANASGYVSTGAQTFSGVKTISDGLIVPTRTVGDATGNAASTQFVNNTTVGLGFSAHNGWVSGGYIDRVPPIASGPAISQTFKISPVKVRYTIAHNDTTAESPMSTRVITLFEPDGYTGTVRPEYNEANAIGIYVDQYGGVHQRPVGVEASQLYDWVQVGALLQITNLPPGNVSTIVNVNNVKLMPANNYELVMNDFINYVSPLNLGPLTVSAGGEDLSINVSEGNIWEQMAAVMPSSFTTNRSSPSVITVPATNKPSMYGVWQENSTTYHGDATQSDQLNVLQYNPNGTGDLATIPDVAPWVNIPILFNAAVNFYFWQYPTNSYTSSVEARADTGNFVRIAQPEFRLINVIGIVTVEKGATDLSGAFFSGGEFFNYMVGGSAGATGSTSSSGAYLQSNTAWVDEIYGSDVTGTWNTASKPYQTYNNAANAAFQPSLENTYIVRFSPGYQDQVHLDLNPYVNMEGVSSRSSAITVSGSGEPANPNIDLHAAWATTNDANVAIGKIMLVNGTGVNFDLYGKLNSTTCKSSIFINDLLMYPKPTAPFTVGKFYYAGRRGVGTTVSTDKLTMQGVGFGANVELDGGNIVVDGCMQDMPYTYTVKSTYVNTNIVLHSDTIGDLTFNTPGAGTTMSIIINSCIIAGTLTVNPGVVVMIDRASIIGNVVNNGTINYYDNQFQISQDQWNALSSAGHTLTQANPVIDTQTLTEALALKADTSALASKVNTTTTINGKALSSNVTLSAADLAVGQLPSGTGATTAVFGDSTNKIATTAFVQANGGGAASVIGLVKCNGVGTFSAASAPADYLVSNQPISLTGDVVGGPASTSIATTISGLALSKLANIATNTVLANVSGAPAAPSALTVTSGSVLGNVGAGLSTIPLSAPGTANAVALRDANGSLTANSFIPGFATLASSGVSLTAGSAQIQEFTGSGPYSVTLPATNTCLLGQSFKIINSSAERLTVYNSSSVILVVLYVGIRGEFTNTASGSPGTWSVSVQSTTFSQYINPTLHTPSYSFPAIKYTVSTTLKAQDLFCGPIMVNTSGVLTLPSGVTMLNYLRDIFGSYPPIGYSWKAVIVQYSTSTFSLASNASGGTLYGVTSGPGTANFSAQLWCWVTSTSSFAAVNMRDY